MFESSRPELRVVANPNSEMQWFESCRPSQRVRSLRVKSDGATLDWRPDIGGNIVRPAGRSGARVGFVFSKKGRRRGRPKETH